jgi:predicted RNA-binding protein with PUA-like domain
MANHWLIKSEPFVFSYADLLRDGRATWDGVRNYQARNNLRAMAVGDLCLFYHSNEGLAVVGVARVVRPHFPDPTAESGDWSAVEVEPFKALDRPITLAEIKRTPALQDIGLVRNPRLSVMPLSEDEFRAVLAMGAP